MSEVKYKKVANIMNKSGGTPVAVNDNLIEILNLIIPEEDYLDFIIKTFRRKASQTMEQIKESSGISSEEEILSNVVALAKKGIMFNQPNRHGVMVFKIMPFINVGLFEYTFMGPLEHTEYNKKLAQLYQTLFDGFDLYMKNHAEQIVPMILKQPPIDRTVPVLKNKETGEDIKVVINEDIEIPEEKIIPAQDIEEIINKFDEIAVGHCFCRHHKELSGDPCKINAPTENCFTFGKSARHVTENGFGRMVSKEEAIKILREAEDAGLIHKAYHPNFDISRDETSMCNCCNCCCGQSGENYPTINASNYISLVDQDKCIGCGTCVEGCHFHAMELNDDNKAERIGEYCVGCGLCAYNCPENAISMIEKPRIVRVPPYKYMPSKYLPSK